MVSSIGEAMASTGLRWRVLNHYGSISGSLKKTELGLFPGRGLIKMVFLAKIFDRGFSLLFCEKQE